ncbi:hypothetical protein DPSP01_008547 [Paraphaeosphaeria sporulosa]
MPPTNDDPQALPLNVGPHPTPAKDLHHHKPNSDQDDARTDPDIIHRDPALENPHPQFGQHSRYSARTYLTLGCDIVILFIIATAVMYLFFQVVEFLSYNDADVNPKYGKKDFAFVLAVVYLVLGR